MYSSQILLRNFHGMHKGHHTPKGTKCSSRAVKSRLQKRTPLWCWYHSSHHRHTLARKARGLHQVQPHLATRWKPLQAALHNDGRFKTDENNDLFTWLQKAEGESPKSGNNSHTTAKKERQICWDLLRHSPWSCKYTAIYNNGLLTNMSCFILDSLISLDQWNNNVLHRHSPSR